MPRRSQSGVCRALFVSVAKVLLSSFRGLRAPRNGALRDGHYRMRPRPAASALPARDLARHRPGLAARTCGCQLRVLRRSPASISDRRCDRRRSPCGRTHGVSSGGMLRDVLQIAAARITTPIAWRVTRAERHGIVHRIGRLHAQHARPLVGAEIGHAGGLVAPGIPHHGGRGARLVDDQPPPEHGIRHRARGQPCRERPGPSRRWGETGRRRASFASCRRSCRCRHGPRARSPTPRGHRRRRGRCAAPPRS